MTLPQICATWKRFSVLSRHRACWRCSQIWKATQQNLSCVPACASWSQRKTQKERRCCSLLSPPFDFFPLPARATLTDVNEALAQFPGGIKAPLPADIAQDLPLVCRRLYARHHRLCFPQWSGITSVACPSTILIARGTAATSAGDELWGLVTWNERKTRWPLGNRAMGVHLAPVLRRPKQVVSLFCPTATLQAAA